MTLVRTNITIPKDVLDMLDEVAGPRGRSAYISELVAREMKRERSLRIIRETAGVLRGKSGWGSTQAEVDANLRAARDSWDRDDRLWPAASEDPDAVSA
jgi:hypothetical protein